MGRVGAIALIVLGLIGVWAYQQVGSMEVEQVTDDVHVIFGLGGNVGVLGTERGVVVVDTMMFAMQGREILSRAEDLGEGPVRAIINTHYHGDHSHGNTAFPAKARIIATERTLAYMQAVDGDYWSGGAEDMLPNETFVDEHRIEVGDKTLLLVHPGPGHTDGDLVVLFVEDRVLHTGDLFFEGHYPNIDLEAGGSVRDWVEAIDRVLELDFDHVIPGHGPVTDRAGLIAFQRFMAQLAAVGAAGRGKPLAEVQASAALDLDTGFEPIRVPFFINLDRDFVIRRAWEEAEGAYQRILPE